MSEEYKLLKESKKLCWEDRLLHKYSKVRYDANVDLKSLCDSVTDPKDDRISQLGHLFKKTVSDSDPFVQNKALDALIAYLKAADANVAGRYAKEVCDAIMAKCHIGLPKIKEKAQMVFILWVELEAVHACLDVMEKAIHCQDAKAVVLATDFMSQALSEFGPPVVSLERIVKMLRQILDHQDQNVCASSKGLTLELCRWVSRYPIQEDLYRKMSDTMKKELDVELPTVKQAVRAPRNIRSAPKGHWFLGILFPEESAADTPSVAPSGIMKPLVGRRRILMKANYMAHGMKADGPGRNKLGEHKDVEPSETIHLKNAAWKRPLEEINQLQKLSLSDPEEQNKMDVDGDPAWFAVDYYDNLSYEELVAEVLPGQQWALANTCTRCGVLGDCSCKRRARLENTADPHRFDDIYKDLPFYTMQAHMGP